MRLQYRDDSRGDQFFALRTFRRDGSPAETPIWLAPSGGRWYGYTPHRSWKVRHICRNAHVEVAPCSFHGDPYAGFRAGRARILRQRRELRVAKRALTAKYGNRFRLFTLLTVMGRRRPRGGRAVGLEITIEDDRPVTS